MHCGENSLVDRNTRACKAYSELVLHSHMYMYCRDEQDVRTLNGIQETIADVTFP